MQTFLIIKLEECLQCVFFILELKFVGAKPAFNFAVSFWMVYSSKDTFYSPFLAPASERALLGTSRGELYSVVGKYGFGFSVFVYCVLECFYCVFCCRVV